MLPVGHSLSGLVIYGIFNQKKIWCQDVSSIFTYIFLANLPDMDFIPVIFGFDSFNVYHRGLTHTLLFSIIAAILFSFGLKYKNKTPLLASFPIFFILIYSHIIIDIFGIDTSPPKGVMALYPLTDQYFTIPLLPPVPHGNLKELFSIYNLKTAIFESSIILPFLFVLYLIKRKFFIRGLLLSLIILLPVIFSINSFAAVPTVGKWDVFEKSLVTQNKYNNPFKEVSLQSTFISPTNHIFNIYGFYDGGNTWKIRFVPNEVGSWTAITISNDINLNNNNNFSFIVVNSDLSGFLKKDTINPSYLKYEEGNYFLPLGDTSGRFIMNQKMKTPPSNWKEYYDEMYILKVNHLYDSLISNPDWDDRGWYEWPFGGSAKSPDFDNYNIEQFRFYDEALDYAESKGIVVSIGLLDWITVPKGSTNVMTTLQKKNYYKYVISRLGHHKNIMFVLYWDIPADQQYVRDEGNYFKSIDPYT